MKGTITITIEDVAAPDEEALWKKMENLISAIDLAYNWTATGKIKVQEEET